MNTIKISWAIFYEYIDFHYKDNIDFGKEYNPLAKADPNTSLALMERRKGGLGIFMVKKSMDDMTYEYKDGKNILRIVKNL